ncbi:septum formation initiator [Pelagivirga sediminicola]|uniref:Septum formation initiator n=1 Tax=Pelagivirga sediminicola TaxID=2170575 RepID=A0A2T7G849_9RHOB|nr:septum formation initiator [Pelagivirga sediminicola]
MPEGDSNAGLSVSVCPQGPAEAQGNEASAVNHRKKPALGVFVYFAIAFALGTYFTFAAVQGDFGLFSRAEIEAEAETLQAQLDELNAEIAVMENLTRRLSDTYLDLDLLDEQARSVIGLLRNDEIVIR